MELFTLVPPLIRTLGRINDLLSLSRIRFFLNLFSNKCVTLSSILFYTVGIKIPKNLRPIPHIGFFKNRNVFSFSEGLALLGFPYLLLKCLELLIRFPPAFFVRISFPTLMVIVYRVGGASCSAHISPYIDLHGR